MMTQKPATPGAMGLAQYFPRMDRYAFNTGHPRNRRTAKDLHQIIKNDPALATKILKVVNSAFYGLPGQVSDLDRAIVLLGLSSVKNIAISASISRLFTSDQLSDGFSARDLWKHSVAVGVVTRQMCAMIGKRAFAEEAFLAGLIHDMGLLVQRQAYPDKLAEVIQCVIKTDRPLCEVEQELVGADHQALGAGLAVKWKFPRVLQTVLGYHHNVATLDVQHRLLPTMVYLADTFCCRAGIGFPLTARNQTVDDATLESVGLNEHDFEALKEEIDEHLISAETTLCD
jgi:HD-like signal output (HDOD) protein